MFGRSHSHQPIIGLFAGKGIESVSRFPISQINTSTIVESIDTPMMERRSYYITCQSTFNKLGASVVVDYALHLEHLVQLLGRASVTRVFLPCTHVDDVDDIIRLLQLLHDYTSSTTYISEAESPSIQCDICMNLCTYPIEFDSICFQMQHLSLLSSLRVTAIETQHIHLTKACIPNFIQWLNSLDNLQELILD